MDIAPYHITRNVNEAKNIINHHINHLNMLHQIIERYTLNQFDHRYDINIGIQNSIQQSLPTTQSHIKDIIKFKYYEHPLLSTNVFTHFHAQSHLDQHDPAQYLESAELEEVFGPENITSSEADPSSDFDPNEESDCETESDVDTDSETEIETDYEEHQQSLHNYSLRISQINSSNQYYYDDVHDHVYLGDCSARCSEPGQTWFC